MLPESINQFISLFKATTIVSLIAVPDLMYQVSMITQQEMRPLPLYTGAALTYFVVILVASNVAARAIRALAQQDLRLSGDMGNWERLVWNQRDALLSGLVVTVEVCVIAFVVRDRRRPAPVPRAHVRAAAAADRDRADRVLPRHADPRAAAVGELRVAGALRLAEHLLRGRLGRAGGAVERLSRRDLSRRDRSDSDADSARPPTRSACRPCSCSGASCCRRCSLSTAPSIVNQFTVIVKSSTLVSVITVPDLMFQSQKIVNIWYEPIEILTATAAIYIVFIFLVSTAGKAFADRLRRRYGIALA